VSKAGQAAIALALLPALSGCIAAVAVLPALTGTAVLGRATGLIRVATPRPKAARAKPVERTAGEPLRPEADAANLALPGTGSSAAGTLTRIGDVPADAEVLARLDPWAGFMAYAEKQARLAEGREQPGRSAILDPSGTLAVPKLRGCQSKSPPAVLIDLDRAAAPFDPAAQHPAPPGLAAGLARLRQQGMVVAWITSAPASEVGQVAEALQSSGLDPEGVDPLLLVRSPEDRKQVLRQQANRDVCVVAIAGDRKGDFDELFDYLRDPASASAFDGLIGQGWFLVPPPLG